MVVNLKLVVQRLKDEHRALRKELDYVHEKTSHMASLHGLGGIQGFIPRNSQTNDFIYACFEEHEHWEEVRSIANPFKIR